VEEEIEKEKRGKVRSRLIEMERPMTADKLGIIFPFSLYAPSLTYTSSTLFPVFVFSCPEYTSAVSFGDLVFFFKK
jgi:hypothetical protein